ncbi:MAG TPA: histidine kinase [Actinomycetota bacterium]|nr:histidine kinase [Actinomycetota bacterium]
MGRSRVWPWIAAIAALAEIIALFVLVELAGSYGWPMWQSVGGLIAVMASVSVGLLISIRRPGNALGALLLANGVILAAGGFSDAYARYALLANRGGLPGGEWAALWSAGTWPLIFAPVTAIAFIFPTGRLPSPRWRRVAFGVTAMFVGLTLVSVLDADAFKGTPYQDRIENPLPSVPTSVLEMLWLPLMVGMLASLFAAVKAVRVRLRGAAAIERLQLKWLALVAFLIPLTVVVCVAEILLTGEGDTALTISMFAMSGGIPVAIGIAVLRHRLYDIDRLISRTVVYSALTVLLAAAYIVTTLFLGTLLGGDEQLSTAGATLATAMAFSPSRRRIQDVVDRRFNRARYDALRRVDRFLVDLRAGQVPPEAIEGLLSEVLSDPQLALRFWLPESEMYVDAHGRSVSDDGGDSHARTPIHRAGTRLAVVLHTPIEEGTTHLLEDVVQAAGLAIEIARLRVELRRQLDAVEASRARIVTAGYEERRRIERDLHDGAQQRLVSIGLALRHAQHQLSPKTESPTEILDEAVNEIGVAITELRELARGVRPAQLDDGLGPALRSLAERTPVPVEVHVAAQRVAPEIEAAAYFIACEGLTNAVKHARASKIRLAAEVRNGNLVVSVADDGIGGAHGVASSGLTGLADRAEAHGGSLRLDSIEGLGTTLTAELPCAS